MVIEALFIIAPKGNNLNGYRSMNGWMHGVYMAYFSASKRNKVPTHVPSWMKLRNTKPHTREHILYLDEMSRKDKFMKSETRLWLPGAISGNGDQR